VKYLCTGCDRLVEPTAVRVDGAEVVLECPRCGAAERVACSDAATAVRDRDAVAEATTTPGPGAPAATCPKCAAPRTNGEACPRCGLIYARWRDDDRPAAPDAAAQLWERLEERWDDDALHEKFLGACLEARDLAFAARCYRGRDDAKAREQLARLTTLSVQAMRGAEKPARIDPRIFRYTGWVLFFLISIALLVLVYMAKNS
jgi:hypothetical protein